MNCSFTIEGRKVGEGCSPFVITEAGINHNGDFEKAKQMVDIAAEAGADAVKFQTFRTEEFLTDRSVPYTYKSQGKSVTESMFDMFKRTELTQNEWTSLKEHCDKRNIVFLSTPVSEEDLVFLISLGVGAVKVGSDDFTNLPLIHAYAKHGLPLLISSGMGDGFEMERVVKTVAPLNRDLCLLLCTSQYPTPPSDVNIAKLLAMRSKFPDVVLGFSDHTQGCTAAVLAVGYGAKVFEKHFTLDKSLPGPDHWFSSDPDELREWVSAIREADKMLGRSELVPTDKERKMRGVMRRSIVALEDIEPGEAFSEKNIGLRRPGTGMAPDLFPRILGRCAKRSISKDTLLSSEDIQ